MQSASDDVTRVVASHIVAARWDDLPEEVIRHSVNAFVNFMGCLMGGSQHAAVSRAIYALGQSDDSSASSPVIGRSMRSTAPMAALFNCMSASVYAFDDTHAEAIVHSSSIIGAALVALAGARRTTVPGKDLLLSFAWGVELTCRLSKALSVAPARADIGWSQSGVTGAIGAAAACGKLFGFDLSTMTSAIGTAACLSTGLRAAHGSMTMHLVPAQAACTGVQAALLAQAEFTGPMASLEGARGYLTMFSDSSYSPSLTSDLGTRFELLANTFKAYPCGIVIHAVIDACLRICREPEFVRAHIVTVELWVPESTAILADRPDPRNEFGAQVSLQHWAAAVLTAGVAGIAQGTQSWIEDTTVRALRERCRLVPVRDMPTDASIVRVLLEGGRLLEHRIAHCTGSLANPLNEAAIDAKCLDQSTALLGARGARQLIARCRSIPQLDDVSRVWRELDATGISAASKNG